MKRIVLLFALLLPVLATAQSYSINWYKIAGGGGTSTNAPYTLRGTIGQQDASSTMTGNQYSVIGGFWSLIGLVQTAGAPPLSITNSAGSVIVFWPNTGSYTLQQNSNLAVTNGWTTSSYSVSTNSGIDSITITSSAGNLFFRLKSP